MVLVSGQSLQCFQDYTEEKVKLRVVHFCPIDGHETDPKCKRTVITSDCFSTANPSSDRLVVVTFYGSLAKTPFKKSALKEGQLFTLQHFQTSIMPKNKVFKCNGHLLKNFSEALIIVKPDFDPIIKMLVSLRDDTHISGHEFDDSSNDNLTIAETNEDKANKNAEERTVPEQITRSEDAKAVRSPTKKKMRLVSDEAEVSSDDNFNTNSRRRAVLNSKNVQMTDSSRTNDEQMLINVSLSDTSVVPNSSQKTTSPPKKTIPEYRTLMQVHSMMPVSGRTYCNVYGILVYRDYKQNAICLRDERVFKFSVSIRPGNSNREYPAAKPGDIIRIHRLLLAPNSLEAICTDPKDVVVFQGFRESSIFSPIHTSLNPSFSDYDIQRKQELEDWFTDHLLSQECLSQKMTNSQPFFTDLAVQVIRVTQQRDRSYLEVWDTTQPALRTLKSRVNTNDMSFNESDEELVRIINENNLSILVTVFEQHSIDASNLKPFDFIVLFNVQIKSDRFNKEFYTYSLNSGYYYGKCIRLTHPDSSLAKKFSSRIEEYKMMSAVNVTQHLNDNQLPDPSLPLELEDSGTSSNTRTPVDEETAMRDSFELQINRIDNNELVSVKPCLLPTEPSVKIPEKDVLFDEVVSNGIDGHIYKVKARLIAYLPSLELEDIVTVYCTKLGCERWITLRQALSECPLTSDTIRSSKLEKIILNCSKCKENNSCILMLRLLLILEDNRRKKIQARLDGQNAELFFGGKTPESLLRNDLDYEYVKKVLTEICPKVQPLGPNKSYNPLNYWVIQALKWEDTNRFIYNVRTAVAIRCADKCFGHNFT